MWPIEYIETRIHEEENYHAFKGGTFIQMDLESYPLYSYTFRTE